MFGKYILYVPVNIETDSARLSVKQNYIVHFNKITKKISKYKRFFN